MLWLRCRSLSFLLLCTVVCPGIAMMPHLTRESTFGSPTSAAKTLPDLLDAPTSEPSSEIFSPIFHVSKSGDVAGSRGSAGRR